MTEETLLTFPCQFPVKVMGKNHIELDLLVLEIVRRHAPDFHEQFMHTRVSKDANYMSVTVTLTATSKQQLDALYQDLSSHPHVIMAL